MDESRSTLPVGIQILAVTATASVSLRKYVVKVLGMNDALINTDEVECFIVHFRIYGDCF